MPPKVASTVYACISTCAEKRGRKQLPSSVSSIKSYMHMAAAVKADVLTNEIRLAPAALALAYRFLIA